MSEFDYPLDTSWNIDIAQDTSLPQHVVSVISQRVSSSRQTAQRQYQPRQREASLHHQAQPWVIPSTAYPPRRQQMLQKQRMRHVSTPLRSNNITSRAPIDGLMIHVEKRARNGGSVAQIPLPSSLPLETSPVAEISSHNTAASRASSQSFAQDDSASVVPSNGPVTPNISPSYGTSPETTRAMMRKPTSGMSTTLQGSLPESVYEQPYLTQDYTLLDQQSGLWNSTNIYPQNGVGYGFYNFPTSYTASQQDSFVYPTDEQYLNDQYLDYRRNFTVPEQVKTLPSKKPARKHFTPEVTNVLKTWFKENLHRPYPSEETKQELLRQTGLTMNQLSNWFINARRRNWRRSRLVKDS